MRYGRPIDPNAPPDLPPLPEVEEGLMLGDHYSVRAMYAYARQARAPLVARIAQLEAALAPFAREYRAVMDGDDSTAITMGDLRRASEVLPEQDRT